MGDSPRGRSEPKPIDDVLRRLMDRLGVVEAGLWNRIEGEWATLAGTPWSAQTRPIGMHRKKLVIEAVSPQAVAMLRYGTTGLVHRLNAQLGDGTVEDVVVRAPGNQRR